MSEIKRLLELKFRNVRETSQGFKFNKNEINTTDLVYLDGIHGLKNALIKRSGVGLVIILSV